jgi:hypothetical protein
LGAEARPSHGECLASWQVRADGTSDNGLGPTAQRVAQRRNAIVESVGWQQDQTAQTRPAQPEERKGIRAAPRDEHGRHAREAS